MRVRPVHIWWIGVLLFLPSCLLWGYFSVMCIWKFKQLGSLDWYGFTHVYLPLVAALVGFILPLLCLRLCRQSSWRVTGWAFAGYLAVVVAWAAADIRHEHYQIGGHDYPNGPLVDGHRYYWHVYFTWYFIPYRWIEHGIHG